MKPVRVAAKAVIVEDGKLLAVRNADAEGFWYILPGGGQEPGEALHAALRRECQEELGVDVDVHELLYVRDYIGRNHEFAAHDSDVHQLELMFSCTIRSGQSPGVGTLPDSSQVGFEWLTLAQLDDFRLYPKVLKDVVGRRERLGYLGDVN
jgi:ADP-ribose pyrophosphatase YjhB (NUDIX family)